MRVIDLTRMNIPVRVGMKIKSVPECKEYPGVGVITEINNEVWMKTYWPKHNMYNDGATVNSCRCEVIKENKVSSFKCQPAIIASIKKYPQ